jgi:hypothetical protein
MIENECLMNYKSKDKDGSASSVQCGWYEDRHCGLVIRVSGYRSRGPGFYSRRFQIFWEAAGLERGPLSLVRTTEELLEGKVAAPV